MHELGIVFHIIDSLKEVGEENHLKQIAGGNSGNRGSFRGFGRLSAKLLAMGIRQNRAFKRSITYGGTNSGSNFL